MTRISFVGIGRMGEHMSANLAKAGFELKLFDLDHARAAQVAGEIGAGVAGSLAEVADCDVVVCMLPTSNDVQDVLLEADGGAFLAHVKPGTIVIDMSSSEPVTTLETGAALEEVGVTMIDAPVSGGTPRAKTGSLAIMIGCNVPEAIDKVTPVLEAMGKQLFRVGGLGAGDAMKAANNFTAAATYAATAEALTMGKKFGLDPALMVDIMNVSTGRSFVSEFVMKEHVVTGAYATGFALALITKDAGIAARLADDLDLDAPLSQLVHDRLQMARANCDEAADHSEAILGWYPEFWEKSE